MPARGLIAHVLVCKYCDHLPLYRQSQIFAREGIDLDRSTLADWVGGASALLEPLVRAIGRYVLASYKIHGDDTPVRVLCPGRKTTKQGRLWTYVRDDRPGGSKDPPAVIFHYSPDRKGERPRAHLASFAGVLQADAYAGFDRLYGEKIKEAACWAHVRRKFYDIHVALASPIATEALERIGRLYEIEEDIRGRSSEERQAVRKARAVALGRKNRLFAGSHDGGERAAALYSLIGTAKLNELDPEAYLRNVLERIADHPINKIDELLPWNVASKIPSLRIAA